jgi:hypothetical protein
LLNHLRQFLLELGVGFAFVGSQYRLTVGDEDFYIDLLFCHLKLRAYVVVDLKMKAFEPEFAGKMNFYLSAVNDLLRHPDDQPSIGIILCRTRERFVAEYALRDISPRNFGEACQRLRTWRINWGRYPKRNPHEHRYDACRRTIWSVYFTAKSFPFNETRKCAGPIWSEIGQAEEHACHSGAEHYCGSA